MSKSEDESFDRPPPRPTMLSNRSDDRPASWPRMTRNDTAPTSPVTPTNTKNASSSAFMVQLSGAVSFQRTVLFRFPTVRSITQKHTLGEHVRGQLHALCFQPTDKRRPHSRGLELTEGSAVLVHSQLFEPENLLHDDHILLHVHHFGQAV